MSHSAAHPTHPTLPLPTALHPGLACPARTLQVLLRTLSDCKLAVSVYPTFSYNAAGGGGSGSVSPGNDGLLRLTFDPSSLDIPAINYQHASILGVPIPPPLNIAIVPQAGWEGAAQVHVLSCCCRVPSMCFPMTHTCWQTRGRGSLCCICSAHAFCTPTLPCILPAPYPTPPHPPPWPAAAGGHAGSRHRPRRPRLPGLFRVHSGPAVHRGPPHRGHHPHH